MAQAMVNNGLQVWTNEVAQDGKVLLGDQGHEFVGSTGTTTVPVMHLWTQEGMNAWTIAHEALHGLGYQHADHLVGPDGVSRSMDQTAKHCSQS